MIITTTPEREAEHFLHNETQFHLGAMLTEQSHRKTRGLSEVMAHNTPAGMSMLLSVDDDIAPVAREAVDSMAFRKMCRDIFVTLRSGNRVFFSGCGSTGRLAILLEAAHRKYCRKLKSGAPENAAFFDSLANQVLSIMTGGDFALIRSVESFEDYISFGHRQILEAGLTSDDCLVAISEGGETSSVIGTVHAALEMKAKTHFVFNNPNEVLVGNVERSRLVIQNPEVNIVNLATGPMAVAGSTRMQATTIEMLVVGTAFESALHKYLEATLPKERWEKLAPNDFSPIRAVDRFERLLQELRSENNLSTLASLTDFEHSIYDDGGLVTYFPCDYSLDIFTDTTERSPTFKIPPFRSTLETGFPVPWAFVKDPLRKTPEAWKAILGRSPRCIDWQSEDYLQMGARESIVNNPPNIGARVLNTFMIGNERDDSRTSVSPSVAIAFLAGDEASHLMNQTDWRRVFEAFARQFTSRAAIVVGPKDLNRNCVDKNNRLFVIDVDLPDSPLELVSHLAMKIVLNNISTASMAKLGRLAGNWMAHVDATNKKLIDRGIRLIAELAEIDYKEACFSLFRTIHEMNAWPESSRKVISPVAYTIEQLKRQKNV